MRARRDKKLGLLDAVGMAVGGMVGGGIFAVLGEAVAQSGNAAFISLGVAGLLALVTGLSYSRLTLDFDAPGGTFVFVEKIVGPRPAGTLSWFLLLGYVFTISLYAYAFGHYTAGQVGLGEGKSWVLGFMVIAFFAVINLMGVRESGTSEDILVYGKLAILALVVGAGMFFVRRSEILPLFQRPVLVSIASSGLIFVAYEGFQLLTYDYADIENKHTNLPKAIWISIPVVTILYMLIAFVTTGTLSDQTIVAHKETVLAHVAEPALGRVGYFVVMVAAAFSTASAINATLFAMARLANQVAKDGQLPARYMKWKRGGVSVLFVAAVAVLAGVIQAAGSLGQITLFASTVFLLVFSVVNLMAVVHRSFSGWKIVLPSLGFLGCLGAAIQLAVTRFESDRSDFWIMIGICALILALRGGFIVFDPEFKGKKTDSKQ